MKIIQELSLVLNRKVLMAIAVEITLVGRKDANFEVSFEENQ